MRIVLPLRFYHSVLFRITRFCFPVILDSYWSMKISRSLFNPVSTISSGHSSLLIPFDISSNFLSQFTNHIRSQNNCFSFSLLDRVLLSSSYSYACSVSYFPYVFDSRFHFQFQFFFSSTSMLLLIGETKTSCFSTPFLFFSTSTLIQDRSSMFVI